MMCPENVKRYESCCIELMRASNMTWLVIKVINLTIIYAKHNFYDTRVYINISDGIGTQKLNFRLLEIQWNKLNQTVFIISCHIFYDFQIQKLISFGSWSVTIKHMEANEIFSLKQIQNASFIYVVPLTKVTNNLEFFGKKVLTFLFCH